jgi:hypothetical protein
MKDFVIHRSAWHIEGDPRGHEVAADLVLAYAPLVAWLNEKGLLSNTDLARKPIDKDFEIRVSDLTPEGYDLFRLAHSRWLRAFDRSPIGELTEEKARKRIETIWEKYFLKLKHGD